MKNREITDADVDAAYRNLAAGTLSEEALREIQARHAGKATWTSRLMMRVTTQALTERKQAAQGEELTQVREEASEKPWSAVHEAVSVAGGARVQVTLNYGGAGAPQVTVWAGTRDVLALLDTVGPDQSPEIAYEDDELALYPKGSRP